SDRQEMRDLYQEKFGEHVPDMAAEVLPQLAKWVSAKIKHVFVAVVPQHTEVLDGWEDSSLAVLRLKLEKIKHLAVYLKSVGARWESTPAVGIQSTPNDPSSNATDTEFWAAMTRDAVARGPAFYTEDTPSGAAREAAVGVDTDDSSKDITTVTAFIQSVGIYDNDPTLHPVVRSLVSVDRSMDAFGDYLPSRDKEKHSQGYQQTTASRRAARNSEKYDVWMYASKTDSVLTVNVGPISTVLNKELVDRLSVYHGLVDDILPATAQSSVGADVTFSSHFAAMSDHAHDRDVADSIENLMRNLKISAEQKMPSKVAVCSPLIRTWILLPGTIGGGSVSEGGGTGSQTRSWSGKDSLLTPGHFCIDAVDA
ncbi:hypothetical protein LPJ57_011143, partial [Coemansia sp. RSA 486]